MNVTALGIIVAVVAGGAASVAGGYLGGAALGGKDLGRHFAGFLGMLYGPTAGAVGVVAGVAIVAALAARS